MSDEVPVGQAAPGACTNREGRYGRLGLPGDPGSVPQRRGVICGHINAVTPGVWAGGIVGLKSILGLRSKEKALKMLAVLSDLGLLRYDLDCQTKKLTYEISDWVVQDSGAECMDGAVYATDSYGFLCIPRNITERLVRASHTLEEADAWLDLWCHTVWNDPRNAFSYIAPAVQYRFTGAVMSLETLGQRWGWEKTKVWRFFQKHGDAFALCRLPGLMAASFSISSTPLVLRVLFRRKRRSCSCFSDSVPMRRELAAPAAVLTSSSAFTAMLSQPREVWKSRRSPRKIALQFLLLYIARIFLWVGIVRIAGVTYMTAGVWTIGSLEREEGDGTRMGRWI